MTAFESFFNSLKKLLGISNDDKIWPTFKPIENNDYTVVNMPNLGRVLVLNCQDCDGPSDPRHSLCQACISKRLTEISNQELWDIPKHILLSRIYAFSMTSEEIKDNEQYVKISNKDVV
ncbi:MAG: hypothetical protein ACP6IU_07795 [Candidatus Asgardarchaeia archaeon]